MAFVPITIYKKSALATVASIFGSIMSFTGIALAFEELAAGIICLLIGIGLMLLASVINKRKIFKLWVKDLTQKGIVQMMPTSAEICHQIYAANQSKMTIDFIAKYNPVVAAELRSKAAKK